MPRGRPTSYKPEYCEMLIAHMSKGLSYETFAATIDVCKDTLYEWEKVHLDFSDSKKIAVVKSQAFWEKIGLEGLWSSPNGPNLNATVWIFNMKNRFKWRDRQPDEDKPQVTIQTSNNLSSDELLDLIKKARE